MIAVLYTRAEVELLTSMPYDEPRVICASAMRQRAARLAKLGLCERQPGGVPGVDVYRCTNEGADVVRQFREKGWLP